MKDVFAPMWRAFSTRNQALAQAAGADYDEKQITDDWFRAHFIYAPDVVGEWLLKSVTNPTDIAALDFGCGDGIMALGMKLRHGLSQVCGVDLHNSNRYLAETASKQIGLHGLPKGLEFHVVDGDKPLNEAMGRQFDFIYSWSVFEHITPEFIPGILKGIKLSLGTNGSFFLQIEPLYYSPYGSHLGGVITEPWAHLLLSDDELMAEVFGFDLSKLQGEFKNKTFDECSNNDFKKYLFREYRSLNRLTITQLLGYCQAAGFSVKECWKGKCNQKPPSALLEKYSEEDLSTAEVRLWLM